ncbi:hypothetical protein ACQPZF_35515 [Actinosynnema sp. CS-041913]|uniref:RNA polymerase sigma factor n=1 Tax=Actinosynnema sp. CS-041913 TaxID=3239917 RepID=UPI003D8BB78E
MNGVEDAWAEFFVCWHPKMVVMGLQAGAARPEAEDAAGAVAVRVMQSWSRWVAVRHQDAYLRRAVVREVVGARRKQAARRTGEARWARDGLWSGPRDPVTDACERGCELDVVRQCLAIAPERRRDVLAWLFFGRPPGWTVADIAAELGICPATVRCQRRHARRDLAPFLLGDGHERRAWLRAGQRVHETFRAGGAGPLTPRPVIADGWARLNEDGLTPDRGTLVELLDRDELERRRRLSPLPAGSPVVAELIDLATRNELLAVVLDSDDMVLHRGGHRDALAAADRLGFLDGACWDGDHAGVTAAGLARSLGAPVTVNRWEHYFPDQHGLCCVAIPVPLAAGGHVTLNLTAAADSLTTVPRAVHRMLDILARRLRKELQASGA